MPIKGGRAKRYQAILRAEVQFYLENDIEVDEEDLDMENVYVRLVVEELDLKQNDNILGEEEPEGDELLLLPTKKYKKFNKTRRTRRG